jgi:hypothetical protein
MNKVNLKRYLNNKNNKEKLKTSCVKDNDKYIISNSFSVTVLNDNYGLDIMSDKYGLIRFKDEFDSLNDIFKTFTELQDNEEMVEPIDSEYGINIKLFKEVNNLIKADKYTILEFKNRFEKYIIKLENTRSGEYAYILPTWKC